MIRSRWCIVVICSCALVAGGLHAQTQGVVTGGLDASNDSDGFNEFKPWAQYEAANGWGVRAGWQDYRMDNWSAHGSSLYLTHSLKTQQLTSIARLGANHTESQDNWVGAWDFNYQLLPRTTLGLSIDRDLVNSRWGLPQGLVVTSGLAVLDHQFSPYFSIGLAAGSSWYSDSNRRDILRSRWTFTLSEDKGLYAYLSTRNYRFSEAYRREYFSPPSFNEAMLGLMWKTALNDAVVISTNLDFGRQSIDGESKPVWNMGLFFSSPHRAPIQWKLGVANRQDHASPLSSSAQSYRYTSLQGFVRMPF